MLFVASKLFAFFTLPSNLLFLFLLVGILLMATRFAKAGRVLTLAALALLVLFGIGPGGNWLIYPLEQRFPRWDATRGAPDGIIVLGGSIGPENSAARGEPALNESAERLTAVAELAKRFPAIPIVFSGGNANLFPGGPSEAQYARRLFESFGIAPDRIVLEDRSRTTAENATLTGDIVKPKPGARWLLVTSAHHMPRSMGVFRGASFPVEAYPVDWRTSGAEDLWKPFASFAGGLARTDAAMHEWIGLVVYWLTGRMLEFLPGPQPAGGCDKAGAADHCRR
jgi:uncharacterized SAM-binding protein YcdF (DUF218 family)